MTQILSSEFWISQWQESAEGSRFHDVYPDDTHIWDLSAQSYDSGMGKSGVRDQALLKILNDMDFWNAHNKRVLDIGSGTGTLAIPLAQHGAIVDALDSSLQMNKILHEKCESAGISGINILHEDFNGYDVSEGTYDMVLGSFNPCLYNPKSFLKMLSLSRDLLVYIGVAGGGSHEKSLAELITGISPGHNGSNHVMYPFNLLLSMGLRPRIDYVHSKWESDEDPERVAERFTRQFEHTREKCPDFARIISDYVERRTQNGKYKESSESVMGIVTCRKQDGG